MTYIGVCEKGSRLTVARWADRNYVSEVQGLMTALNAVLVSSAAVVLEVGQGSDAGPSILTVICVPPAPLRAEPPERAFLTFLASTVSGIAPLFSGPMFIRHLYV